MATLATVEEYATKFEQEFSLVSIGSSVGSSSFENVWVVDNCATKHMSGCTAINNSYMLKGRTPYIGIN